MGFLESVRSLSACLDDIASNVDTLTLIYNQVGGENGLLVVNYTDVISVRRLNAAFCVSTVRRLGRSILYANVDHEFIDAVSFWTIQK